MNRAHQQTHDECSASPVGAQHAAPFDGIERRSFTAGLDGSAFLPATGLCGCARAYVMNVWHVADHPAGFGVYLYEYREPYREKWGSFQQVGVLADEVAGVIPGALVLDADGHTVVDYNFL